MSTRPSSSGEAESEASLVLSHDEFMMAVDRDEFLEVKCRKSFKKENFTPRAAVGYFHGTFTELNWRRNQYSRSIIINLIP